jgi:hypothetical protein
VSNRVDEKVALLLSEYRRKSLLRQEERAMLPPAFLDMQSTSLYIMFLPMFFAGDIGNI